MQTFIEVAKYADNIVLWSAARGKQGSPACAALERDFNWTVWYIKQQGQRRSHDKAAILLFSPRSRVPLTRPELWLYGRRVAHVSVFKYLELNIDDRVNWRLAVQARATSRRLLKNMH